MTRHLEKSGRGFGKARLRTALVLLFGLRLVTLIDAQTEKPKPEPTAAAIFTARPDLIGEVHLTNGQPVMATVFIAEAGPKVGAGTFCPSCYADCVKRAKADEQGHFKIESLDPALIFRVLVVAPDCKPKYVGKIDPSKGPLKVELEQRDNADAAPGNRLIGRVVDSQGKPIVGATVEPDDPLYKGNHTGVWALDGVDPMAVTDERGGFLMTSRDPFVKMNVKVEARGFARNTFRDLASGNKLHDLTLTEGAEVSGRLIWQGKPVAGASVGIVSVDRGEHFAGDYEVGTGTEGRFQFANLPPDTEYYLYGMMQSLQNYGAVQPPRIKTKGDRTKMDAGDLIVGSAHTLRGKVILDDGSSVPLHTQVSITFEDTWAGLETELSADGCFKIAGLHSCSVSVGLDIPGYRISAKNISMDPWGTGLIGRVDMDITNLIILLEKGKPVRSFAVQESHPENRPLRGVDADSVTKILP